MTDNEIVKALECCIESNSCSKCPFVNIADIRNCTSELSKNALDLINRQKAEIEKWQGGYMTQKQEISNLEIELKAMRGAANSYKAEIERLKFNLKAVLDERADHSEAKSEAYKEFAERLKERFAKEKINECYIVIDNDVDNILKELVGDENDKK